MFIDVDYPELIKKKCDVITTTPQLQDLLQPREVSNGGPIFLRSERYTALGCDLTNTKHLETILANEFEISKCLLLCTAELSVTYMNVEAADLLIEWAAQYDDSMLPILFWALKCCLTDSVSTILSS